MGANYLLVQAIAYFLLTIASLVLVGGGLLLLLRKSAGKFVTLTGIGLMVGGAVLSVILALILSKFRSFDGYVLGMGCSMFFTLAVGGFIGFVLFNKDATRVLK